jgi:hypothetical protein
MHGNAHVLEVQLGSVARVTADLLELAGNVEPPGLRRDEEEAAAVGPSAGSVLASRVTKSARVPLVMKVLDPLMT